MPVDLAKAKELFLAVLDMPAGERASHLDTACAGDTELRDWVAAMLETHQHSGELLPRSPAEMLADSSATEADATAAFPQVAHPSATQIDSPNAAPGDLHFLAPPSKPEHLGRLGHYDVQQIIGRGGFGIVLKAFDERLHRVVAIKVLSPAYAANGSARTRFIREAKAVAAVKNEHVVGIHDVDPNAQPPYFVMEFIDGVSLQDKIDKQGALALKEILRIGMQIAEGLAAAHRQGQIHRDIKPANILLENGVERVKITDFGLARAVDDASVTQSGTVAGTPMYMSPEQAAGLPIDHRSDLFSLGTVLYAMCTGHPPFRASGTHAVLKRVIDASTRPIREVNNEMPDWLCDIISKLHAKKPEDRFQTAKEVAEVLGQRLADVQAGRAIEGRAEGRKAPVEAPAHETINRPLTGPGSPSRGMPWAVKLVLAVIFMTVLLGVMLPVSFVAYRYLSSSSPQPPGPDPWADDNLVVTFDDPAVRVMVYPEAGGEHGFVGDFDQQVSAKLEPGRYLVHATMKGVLVYQQWVDVEAGKRKSVQVNSSWVQLFNGKDRTGWQPSDQWRVKDGILIGTGPGFLISQRIYHDFQCRLKVKPSAAAAASISFRGKPYETHGEIALGNKQVLGMKAGSFHFFSKAKSEWAAKWTQEHGDAGDWLELDLIVHGKKVTAKVNGTTTANLVYDELPAEGLISLNAYEAGTVLEFSKIEIKELPPEPSEWVQLFNRKDFTGWENLTKDQWSIDNAAGELICNGQAGRPLVYKAKTFRDFHLRCDVEYVKQTQIGIYFRASPGGSRDLRGYETMINSLGRRGSINLHTQDGKGLHDGAEFKKEKLPVWHQYEVIARGSTITVKLDGAVVSEITDSTFREGLIGFDAAAGHGEARFRRIEIKELPPEPPALPAVAPFDAKKAKEHQDAWAKHLGVEPEITNSIGMKLRLIPPGKNTLGASGSAESADAFFMGTTEVTVEQFRRFVKEAKYQTAGEVNKQGGMRVHKGKPTERMPEYIWSHPDFARGDNHPVTQVTWHDAIAFCAWLSKNEGRTYRLPTIPEWRWAERAGTDAGFYFGGASANFDAHAWHVGNSEMHSHAVGAKARNPWGLFDIYGNVWELSYDWQRNGKPVDLKLAKAGPGASDRILFLGGAFSALVDSALTPATGPPNIGYSHLGFRVVIVGDLKEKPPAAQTTTAQVFVIPANDKPNPKYAVAEFGGWRLEPGKPGEIRLFELPGLDVDDCWLIYRAKLKTDLLRNGVSLEMWGKRGEQEGGSTGNHQVAGITDWTTYETIFHVVKGRPVQNFTLGLRVHGDQPPNGRIWIKDVEVLLKQVAK